jgi:hypothetical protein
MGTEKRCIAFRPGRELRVRYQSLKPVKTTIYKNYLTADSARIGQGDDTAKSIIKIP